MVPRMPQSAALFFLAAAAIATLTTPPACSQQLQWPDARAVVAAEPTGGACAGAACRGGVCPACSSAPPHPECVTCCCGSPVHWKQVPVVRPMPRSGMFYIAPDDAGPYSLADALRGIYPAAPPRSGYPPIAGIPPSFFDTDWRYVDTLPPGRRTLVESLKRVHLGDCFLFATGGQVWTRYMHEYNSRLQEANNDYLLVRNRVWGDLWFKDTVRVYGEYLWADTFGEDLAPLATDINLGDILNLFVEVKVLELDGRPVQARVGRQELLLGSQRMVSTLDWANTRRTFEGVRVFRQGETWDWDMFWTQFVPPRASEFDRADHDQDFAGAWLTHRPRPGEFHDYYYLYYNNRHPITQQDIRRAPLETNTLGTRHAGSRGGYLWDIEAAVQFGRQDGQDLLAGMATVGGGYHFADAPLSPTWWVYYDWASGDPDPGSGRAHTFNQLFPFGHHYLGWVDQVGRQNIHDLNTHLFLFPANWITVWLQYHHFWLDEPRDALYNAGGVAIRRDPSGGAGTNVGDELDVVLNFHLARYSDVLVGYSKLWGGGFLERTAGNGRAADTELFYAMFSQRW